jgi:hypothetical protein
MQSCDKYKQKVRRKAGQQASLIERDGDRKPE